MDKTLSNINLVIIRSNIHKSEFKIWKIIFLLKQKMDIL